MLHPANHPEPGLPGIADPPFDERRRHGMRIKVARIFNTYGPRIHPATSA
jgi:hypothetical protein